MQRLQASYAAIPPGAPVRLAKRTSNLFRPRAALEVPGLDVSGLDGVLSVDPVAAKQSFAGRTRTEMDRVLAEVDAAEAASASYRGMAVHDRAGWTALVP